LRPTTARDPRRAAFRLRFADDQFLELGRQTAVMGILNVTPDSFSDGGVHARVDDALASATRMVAAGAAFLDVGGESTRPGAAPVSAAEECDRVLPVIEAIRSELDARLSVDTMKAEVARQALEAGADLVNDVSGLRDPEMIDVLRDRNAPVVIMHLRGDPATMQRDTRYGDLLAEIAQHLRERVDAAVTGGVAGDRILVDPGIGFGKSLAGNLEILGRLDAFDALELPILVGASRKTFIGSVLDLPVDQRLEGSLAVAAYAVARGAHVIRAHDVEATVRTVRMIDAVLTATHADS
jgi:dihydropteroate synthase